MTVDTDRTGSELAEFHETSLFSPIAVFMLTFGVWAGLLAVGIRSDDTMVRAALSVPLAVASGQLFMIGHDAAHGSFSPSRAANAVVGRLALLPSMHVFGLWRTHHEQHHRFTNLEGRDFVWTPLTVAEYQRLPRVPQALHRTYRNRFGTGLGLQYAIEIWVPRMLWPRLVHELAERRRLLADVGLFYAMVAAVGCLSYYLSSQRISAVVFLFVVPLVLTQWLIGFVIYLNHTHPDIAWYDDPVEWARHDVQLEGSAAQRFPTFTLAPVPRRILNHTAHHVDPGIPLRSLGPAQQQLIDRYPDQTPAHDWSWRAFSDVLSRCKLYDYEAREWSTYDGRPA